MKTNLLPSCTTLLALAIASAAHAGASPWVRFADETLTRLVAEPGVGDADPDEKDFAWGDLDHDGDVDLVVVRKQGWSSSGGRRNVLFMNEGLADGQSLDGVLVDRTLEYASAATDGGQGMLDVTNDRDVVLVDVDGDGWLDVVTACTLSEGLPKTISHPRVYMNLGDDAQGDWLGLRYEEARIPQLHPTAAPRFNAVAAGDVTGDGAPDLYFVNSDGGGLPEIDLNDRLLVNDGTGHFTDESAKRMTEAMLTSSFGTAGVIIDLNGDGRNDIVKSTTGFAPVAVFAIYNDPDSEGTFTDMDAVYQLSPTHVIAGDVDLDGLPDLVVTDDGTDRILLNTGNGVDGLADFLQTTLPGTGGFGGNSVLADLDLDGLPDIVMTDIDFEISGCNRETFLLQNTGGDPPVFANDPGTLTEPDLGGVHDAAVFDLDGDGLPDLVFGRCSGLAIFHGIGAVLSFDFPGGLPRTVAPGAGATVTTSITAIGQVAIEPGTATVHASIDGGPFAGAPMSPLGGGLFEGALPPADCGSTIAFYITVDLVGGGTANSPAGAPVDAYSTIAADTVNVARDDDLEGDVSSWTIANDPALVSGGWEAAAPNGTILGGDLAAPDADATPAGTIAFVTGNGAPGESASTNDVDGGPTVLETDDVALGDGFDGFVSYSRWFFCDDEGGAQADELVVEISGDGGATWHPLETVIGTGGAWEAASFRIADVLPATPATVRLRFSVEDLPNDSITEAGVDDLLIETADCIDCPGDTDGSGTIDVTDLVHVIVDWGTDGSANGGDVDGSGLVDVADLVMVIVGWGAC